MLENEKLLIQKSQAGDEQAFTKLVKEYYGRIMNYVYGMTKNKETALDYTQEIFIKAFRHIGSFHGTSSFYTWVYRIASNYTIDQFRKKHIKLESSSEYDDRFAQKEDQFSDYHFQSSEFSNPSKNIAKNELRTVIFRIIEQLPPKQREILQLREIDGFSYEEIANIVNCSKGTVMSRLFHARKKAQKVLKQYLKGGSL